MSVTNFQKLLVKAESTFGAGTGDFSGVTGLRVYPAEKVGIDGLTQKMEPTSNVVSGWSELAPLPSLTLKEGTLSVKTPFPGNTRSSGAITEDYFSIYAKNVIGTRTYSPKDTLTTACTTGTLIMGNLDTFQVNDLVMVAGEVRLITAFTVATKTAVLNVPLSSAPASGTVCYGVESFAASGSCSSVAIGLEHDFAGEDVLALGCIAKEFNITGLSNADSVKLETVFDTQTHSIGSGLVTVTSTNETQNSLVTPAQGGQVCIKDASNALLELQCKTVELKNNIQQMFIDDLGSVNGKGGFVKVPGENITVDITCYETSTVMTSLISALTVDNSFVCQIGTTAGSTVGFCLKDCNISEYPKFTDNDKKLYIKFQISGSSLFIFRA